MTDQASAFVEQYLKHGDEWERSLYEAVGRVTVAGAAVEGALFSLASQLAPAEDLYGSRIERLRSVIQANMGSLSEAHRKRCAQLLTETTRLLKDRNLVVHLSWLQIPFHEGKHLGVGIRRAPGGEGLLGQLRSTEELAQIGLELRESARSLTSLQADIANG